MTALFRFLSPVFASTLFSIGDPGAIQNAANNMIPYARQVANATAAYNHRTMLLKVMIDARNISGHLFAIG